MAAQNDLIQGINLAGQSQASGADLEQLVRQATPNSNIAFILTGATPDVVNNSRFSRYTYVPSPGSWIKYYDTVTGTWLNVPLPDDIVTSGKILDGSVTLAKIDHTAGAAYELLRVNAAATGLEWWTFSLDDGSVTMPKLSAGTANQVLVTNAAGTQAMWKSADTWFTDLAAKVVSLSNFTQSAATTNQVISWTGTVWAPAAVDTLIAANTIGIDKLKIGTGSAGQVMRVNAGATAFELGTLSALSITPGAANQVLQTNSSGSAVAWQTLFTKSAATVMSGSVSLAASLTYTPKFVRCVLSPTTAQNGYATTDEVDISMITGGISGTSDYKAGFYFEGSTGAFKAHFVESRSTGAVPLIVNKTSLITENMTMSNWNVYFIYSNF